MSRALLLVLVGCHSTEVVVSTFNDPSLLAMVNDAVVADDVLMLHLVRTEMNRLDNAEFGPGDVNLDGIIDEYDFVLEDGWTELRATAESIDLRKEGEQEIARDTISWDRVDVVRVEVSGATLMGATGTRELMVTSPEDGLRPWVLYETEPDGVAYIDLILSGTVAESGDQLTLELWLEG